MTVRKEQFKLRKTNESDKESLFSWRNDPSTYKYFLNPNPVEWNSHISWLIDSLKNPDRWMFTGEMNKIPVSSVRIDRKKEDDGEIYEFSWLVAPEWRGKGFGKKTLEKLLQIKLLKNKLLKAVVHKENVASIKLSERLGFVFKDKKDNWLNYYKNN